MHNVRYTNIAAKITGWMSLLWILALVALGSIAYVTKIADAENLIYGALPLAFLIALVSLKITLPKICARYQLAICRNGEQVLPTYSALIGLAWGLMWRIAVVSILLKTIINVMSASNPPALLDMVGSLATFFLSSLWLLKNQMGGTTIEKIDGNEILIIENENSEVVMKEVNPVEVAKEGITKILITSAYISYIGVGFVQLGAIVSFFHDYWGWWYIPSFFIATFVAYIPLVGSIAGVYAAFEVWHWQWYWAALLFFFPIVLAILGVGVGGLVALVTSKFKR